MWDAVYCVDQSIADREPPSLFSVTPPAVLFAAPGRLRSEMRVSCLPVGACPAPQWRSLSTLKPNLPANSSCILPSRPRIARRSIRWSLPLRKPGAHARGRPDCPPHPRHRRPPVAAHRECCLRRPVCPPDTVSPADAAAPPRFVHLQEPGLHLREKSRRHEAATENVRPQCRTYLRRTFDADRRSKSWGRSKSD